MLTLLDQNVLFFWIIVNVENNFCKRILGRYWDSQILRAVLGKIRTEIEQL